VPVATARLREILAGLTEWPTYRVWAPIVEAELLGVPGEGDPEVWREAEREAWRRAVDTAESPLAPAHLRPYALLRLAQASAEAGDRTTAEQAAGESRQRASALGFGLIVQEVDRLTERALARRHPVARTSDQALTEREAQVLALIEQGLSNKQIGEMLYISAKTASVHVSSILKKVGATSRTEAVYRVSRAAH
jgi:DNA-binding CsgD family transcriptional regulator